jgi:hypothetical protein
MRARIGRRWARVVVAGLAAAALIATGALATVSQPVGQRNYGSAPLPVR